MKYLTKEFFKTTASFLFLILLSTFVVIWVQERADFSEIEVVVKDYSL